MKIKEVILNTKNGNIYIVTYDNPRKRCLYKDNYGYFCKTSSGVVDRFTTPSDIKKIENALN